jgi:hypothetical protein
VLGGQWEVFAFPHPLPQRPFPPGAINLLVDGLELFDKVKLETLINCGTDPETCQNVESKMVTFCENISLNWSNDAVEGNSLVVSDGVNQLEKSATLFLKMKNAQSPMQYIEDNRRLRILPQAEEQKINASTGPKRKLQSTCDVCSKDESHPYTTKIQVVAGGYKLGINALHYEEIVLFSSPLATKGLIFGLALLSLLW